MADTTRAYLAAGTTSLAAVAANPNLRLLGFSAVETAAAVATISIQDAASTTLASEVAGVNLAASESVREWYGEHGIPCPLGIWVNRISGTTRIIIYYRISDSGKDSFSPPSW